MFGRLKRIPFLDTLIFAILCVVAFLLRLLPGVYSVVFKYDKVGGLGGSAYWTLSVTRPYEWRPSQDWLELRYEFKPIDLPSDNRKPLPGKRKGKGDLR